MPARRSLWIVCLVATLHGAFFIWYQSADWTTSWSDQEGYRRLGQVLATTGKFTRFPDSPTFVPEVLRTPAYPLFVAAIYRVFGPHQIAVAVAQVALFAVICLLVYAIGRRIVSERTAWIAALATALFPPIPYFAALTMTEVWTTLWFTVVIWLSIRALDEPRTGVFALLGLVTAVTALSRPVFVLFPLALAAVGIVVLPWLDTRRAAERPSLLILDLLMPGMNGNALYDEMQKSPALKRIPVLVTTSDPTRAPRGVPTLAKPLRLDKLLSLVAFACGRI